MKRILCVFVVLLAILTWMTIRYPHIHVALWPFYRAGLESAIIVGLPFGLILGALATYEMRRKQKP